jgi:hypothetical protein
MNGDIAQSELAFSKSLAILEHHWGPQHPYQTTIYGVMANLMMCIDRMPDARFLLMSSLTCCQQVLGVNHIMTAKVHEDIGKLQVRMGVQSDALNHFKQSFQILSSYLHDDDSQTESQDQNNT